MHSAQALIAYSLPYLTGPQPVGDPKRVQKKTFPPPQSEAREETIPTYAVMRSG